MNNIPETDDLNEIKNYLTNNNIENVINDIINDTLKVRPENPLQYMSSLLKDKSTINKGIKRVMCRQIFGLYFKLYFRNNYPIIEVSITTECGDFTAYIPNTINKELLHGVVYLTDNSEEYEGYGVNCIIEKIKNQIAPQLADRLATDQESLDNLLKGVDSTEDKSEFGGNCLLPLSIAICKAGATSFHIPIEQHILNLSENPSDNMLLPIISPTLFIKPVNGCLNLITQELRLLPIGFNSAKEAIFTIADLKMKIAKVIREEYGENVFIILYIVC